VRAHDEIELAIAVDVEVAGEAKAGEVMSLGFNPESAVIVDKSAEAGDELPGIR